MSKGGLSRQERSELDRRRALQPTLTAASTGGSLAALGMNLGGHGARLVGQKKKFNPATNMTEWVDRKGVKPGSVRHKISRAGGRVSGMVLPATVAAGALGAAASVNAAKQSKLWNKRDNVYGRVEREKERQERAKLRAAENINKAYETNYERSVRRNRSVVRATEGHPSVPQTVGAAAIGAGSVFGGQAGYNVVRGAQAKNRLKTVQTAQRRYKVPKDFRNKASADARRLRSNIRNYSRSAKRSGAVGLGLAAGGGALVAGAEALNRRAKRNLDTELLPRDNIYKSSVPREIAGKMLPPPLYNFLQNSRNEQQKRVIIQQIEQKPSLLDDDAFIKAITGGLVGLSVFNVMRPGRFAPANPNQLMLGVLR